MHRWWFVLFLALSAELFGQTASLQSGPMVGHTSMTEAVIWLQTSHEAEVWAEYRQKDSLNTASRTEKVRTQKGKGFTAKLFAEQLQPGKEYSYQVYINGHPISRPYPTEFKTQHLWQWRTDPPTFTLATGSCAYVNEPEVDRPGVPYGGDYQIYSSIAAQNPDVMLWLGDNTYLREVDWHSRSGIYHRYTHTRSLEELQPLLATGSHYAIWDDHDYGPNNSDRTFIYKESSLDAFQDFWANPTTGLSGEGGITSAFQWGDIDFFLMDNRWFRTPNNCVECIPTILGRTQRDWLIEALISSSAPFKVVAIGGQVLNTASVHENYVHRHKLEREWILRRLEEENIQGVVFLTGDRHHTELSALQNGQGNMVYDLTVSPLTSTGARNNENEGNLLRVSDTYVPNRNFAMLTFSGKRHQRILTIRVHDANGILLWEKAIEQSIKK